jgi:hypothetical protein
MRYAFLLLLLPALAGAQVFKWTDEKGKVHYGDAPPSLQGTQTVNTNRNAVPSSDLAAQRQRLNDEEIDRLARSRSSPECVFKYKAGDAAAKRAAEAETFKCMREVVRREYRLAPPSGSTTGAMASQAYPIDSPPQSAAASRPSTTIPTRISDQAPPVGVGIKK